MLLFRFAHFTDLLSSRWVMLKSAFLKVPDNAFDLSKRSYSVGEFVAEKLFFFTNKLPAWAAVVEPVVAKKKNAEINSNHFYNGTVCMTNTALFMLCMAVCQPCIVWIDIEKSSDSHARLTDTQRDRNANRANTTFETKGSNDD